MYSDKRNFAVVLLMTEWEDDGMLGYIRRKVELYTSHNSEEVASIFQNLSLKIPNALGDDPNTKYDISLVAGEPDDKGCNEELGELIVRGADEKEIITDHFNNILNLLMKK